MPSFLFLSVFGGDAPGANLDALLPSYLFHRDGSGIDQLDLAFRGDPNGRLALSLHGAVLENDLIKISGNE